MPLARKCYLTRRFHLFIGKMEGGGKRDITGLDPVLHSILLNKLPDIEGLSLEGGSPLWKAGLHFKTILLS